ncbi:sirohydrochlorin chelatase [Streptomyces sp. NPDC005355]|uniref:sirohydrochlorin chelatase n=1 Tax=Streptomyces sp. NPDC005355 TaxID=3157038 RepID=UPI0033B65DC2
MTASNHPGPFDFDSTAQLVTQITAQLTTQLSHLGLSGARRGGHHPPPDRPPTLVAVAHGSRDPAAPRTVTALMGRVRALRPDVPVRIGHIELNQPLLADTLAALRGEAVVVPLLLGRGYHIKQDIPSAVAAAPHLAARIAAPLGPHPLLAEALHARLAEAGRRGVVPPGAGVVLAAAGSRDPDATVDAARTAALLSARLGGVPVLPGYASGSGPTVPEAIRALAALGREPTAVASYFAAPGRFATQCAGAAPGIAAAPLGAHPAMARLVLHRYEQALTSAPLSHPAATVGV